MFSPPGDTDLFQKYKQQTYRLAFPLGVIVTVLFVIIVAPEGSLRFYLGISMSVLLLLLSVLVWRGTQHLSLVEFIFYFVVVAYFFILTQLSISAVVDRDVITPSDLADPLNSLALWLVIFMLAGSLTLKVAHARWLIAYSCAGAILLCANNLWFLAANGLLSAPMIFRWVNPLSALLITLLLLQRMGVLQQRRATTDALTGLMNRHALYSVLGQEMDRAKRYHHPFSIILFDLDHFKTINDTLGHMTGDLILAEISKRVALVIRKSDHIGRWGGEEFLLVLPETEMEAARALAERIREMLLGTRPIKTEKVTASFGVASLDSLLSLDELLHRADAAMYAAKRKGRNQVAAYQGGDVSFPNIIAP